MLFAVSICSVLLEREIGARTCRRNFLVNVRPEKCWMLVMNMMRRRGLYTSALPIEIFNRFLASVSLRDHALLEDAEASRCLFSAETLNDKINKPAAQAAGADPSRCSSTNRQSPSIQQNRRNS